MVKVRERIWVGIDVGKASHHACAVDETGKVVFSQQTANGQAAIEALIARAGKAGGEVCLGVGHDVGHGRVVAGVVVADRAAGPVRARPVGEPDGRRVRR